MHELSVATAWDVLRHCARIAREIRVPGSFAWRDGQLMPLDTGVPSTHGAIVHWDGVGRWSCVGQFSDATADFLELYFPLCAANATRPVTVAHLGQSLDGYVATSSGDSQFVNDAQNIVHLHRMRALCDAVVVGGATVRDDDPRLTTRLVDGDNPLRVVIDPQRQLRAVHRVFNDGAVTTLWVVLEGMRGDPVDCAGLPSQVQMLSVRADASGKPDLRALLHALHLRGCHAVFVEGGGITVSRFADAGLLDRMQIAVAPLLIGQGRTGVRLAGHKSLEDCLRPAHRLFRMGVDLLFDCDLRAPAQQPGHRDDSTVKSQAQDGHAAPLRKV